ncbi:MAG: hypothetical protein ABIO15_05990 [Terrimesophilobacter sp.]
MHDDVSRHTVVHEGGIRRQRLGGIDNRRQRLVLHAYAFGSILGQRA